MKIEMVKKVDKRGLEKKARQGIALSIIFNLVLAILAFGFMIGLEVEVVSGEEIEIVKRVSAGGGGGHYLLGKNNKVYLTRDEKIDYSGIWDENEIKFVDGGKMSSVNWEKYEETIDFKGEEIPEKPKTTTLTKAGGSSGLSKILGIKETPAVAADEGGAAAPWVGTGGAFDAILSGVQWAGVAYMAGQMIGSVFGLEQGQTDAVSAAMAAGFGTGKLLSVLGQEGGILGAESGAPGVFKWVAGHPAVMGIAVGLIVLNCLWKSEEKKIVTFECHPWEAPVGGENCEECNNDLYACTEYRCKSLGQACELVNPGTEEEKCIWKNRNDVNSPIIKVWEDPLSEDYNYKPSSVVRPPDRGVEIVRVGGGCVKAFTPISFGIKLDEPAQCKLDYNRSGYEEMGYYFGGSNLYKYNHTQELRLPGPDHINNNVPEIQNDGNYNLYVRCQDANGNQNDDLFVFSFCVEKGPDVTPPKIEGTSIENRMPIQYGKNQTNLEVYTNEPSECKWSRLDQDYKNMENDMDCDRNVWEMNNQMLYKCTTTLTGLQDRKENNFYFKCKDQPWLDKDRNVMTESYEFILTGTQTLNILNSKPNGTIKGYTSPVKVELEVETGNGYNYGDAWCSYSLTEEEEDYIQMMETGSNKHKQRLDLSSGQYTYYFQCGDKGGNAAYSETTFNVEVDENPPEVVRIYKEEGKLKIITDEISTCSYALNKDSECDFEIEEGNNMPYSNSTEHFAEWEKRTYYIKCKDESGRDPLPNECSIIVKPRD